MILRRAAWRAIGTNVDLLVSRGDIARAQESVVRFLDEADRTLSRFRADSELNRVQHAHRPNVVSPLLALAIDAATRAAEITEGLVDPTVGRVLRLVGYDVDIALVATRSNKPPVLGIETVPGWRAIDWDPARRLLNVPSGVELDLGSTGKALIADLAAGLATDAGGADGVLVSVGGDIATAGTAPDGGWRISLAENSAKPRGSARDGDPVVAIASGALATSSTTVRRWRAGGAEMHHLIDPRTARPTTGPWRTVTAVAEDCVDANVCATAAIILGDEAVDWLTARGVAARLVARDGSITYVGGWPESPVLAA